MPLSIYEWTPSTRVAERRAKQAIADLAPGISGANMRLIRLCGESVRSRHRLARGEHRVRHAQKVMSACAVLLARAIDHLNEAQCAPWLAMPTW